MLAEGQLPRHGPNQITAAYGDGRPCDICGEASHPSVVTYELRFGAAEQSRLVLAHFTCFDLWDRERTET
jgi:hypothetical protein